jgi:hypothetical protein
MTFPIKVLFLAANGVDAQRLRLDEEARDIEDKISRVDRQAVALVTKGAVRAEDLQCLLNEHRPDILHFSGHGAEDAAIDFVSNGSRSAPVFADAFSQVLSASPAPIRVVVLNACYSDSLAKTLLPRIPVLIGMRTQIGDPAALAFSCGFYGALASRLPVQKAFEQGCAEIAVRNLNEAETPVLHHQDGIDPAGMLFSRKDGTREQATASSNQSKTVTAPSETQASFEASLLERILIELNTPELKPLQLAFIARAGGGVHGASMLSDAVTAWWRKGDAPARLRELRGLTQTVLKGKDVTPQTERIRLLAGLHRVLGLVAMGSVSADWVSKNCTGSNRYIDAPLRFVPSIELVAATLDDKFVVKFTRATGSEVKGSRTLDPGRSFGMLEDGWESRTYVLQLGRALWKLEFGEDAPDTFDDQHCALLADRFLTGEDGVRSIRYEDVSSLSGHPLSKNDVRTIFSELFAEVSLIRFNFAGSTAMGSPLVVKEGPLVSQIQQFLELLDRHDIAAHSG